MPTVEEFTELLLAQPANALDAVVQEYVFEGVPYVFRNKPQSLRVLLDHLSSNLGITLGNAAVVGSAKVGFSLDPDNFPRQFSDDSDIDVIVVDHLLFDEIWATMLKWNYPRRISGLSGVDRDWAAQRRKDVYWGWFRPDAIRFDGLTLPHVLRPLRDIGTRWFNTFRSLSRYPEFIHRDVHGRLYRSWDHARLYHADGLRQIKDFLQSRPKKD
jgi:hypothetical protein